MRRGWLVAAAALALCAAAQASEPRDFVRGSQARILRQHQGERFVLVLWSRSCAPCLKELALLGRLWRKDAPLVLVSTDLDEDRAALAAVLERHGLAEAESWVFADEFVEALRAEIDPAWRGELPRAYLYGRDGTARGHSGALEAERLEAWLAPP